MENIYFFNIYEKQLFVSGRVQVCSPGEGDCRVAFRDGSGRESEAQAASGTSGARAEGGSGLPQC